MLNKLEKMEKIKMYVYLVPSLLNFFMLGAYTDAMVFGVKQVEVHEFAISVICGILFLCLFINKYRQLCISKTYKQ